MSSRDHRAARGQRLDLEHLLATAVNGNQPHQTFVVTYTDGTTSSFTQSVSDWFTPQNYAGESKALKMAYRIAPSGATSAGPVYLYGYSFALNSAKTVQSLTLPNNRNVVVLAVDVSPTGSPPPPTAASPTLSPPPGSYTSAQSVTLADTTPGAVIYYTTNGTAPTLNSAKYNPGTPVSISSTTTLEAIAVASGYSNSAVSGGIYITTIGSSKEPRSGQRQSLQPSIMWTPSPAPAPPPRAEAWIPRDMPTPRRCSAPRSSGAARPSRSAPRASPMR